MHPIDETKVSGEGWWGDIDNREYEENGDERYSDESDDPSISSKVSPKDMVASIYLQY
ncbi:unnamed protein product [Penicillium discolor]